MTKISADMRSDPRYSARQALRDLPLDDSGHIIHPLPVGTLLQLQLLYDELRAVGTNTSATEESLRIMISAGVEGASSPSSSPTLTPPPESPWELSPQVEDMEPYRDSTPAPSSRSSSKTSNSSISTLLGVIKNSMDGLTQTNEDTKKQLEEIKTQGTKLETKLDKLQGSVDKMERQLAMSQAIHENYARSASDLPLITVPNAMGKAPPATLVPKLQSMEDIRTLIGAQKKRVLTHYVWDMPAGGDEEGLCRFVYHMLGGTPSFNLSKV
ncbi:hypothetical protein IAT38_001430 [Cryptococcus sp. DSM 104549]